MVLLLKRIRMILDALRRKATIIVLGVRNRFGSESALGDAPVVVSLTSHGSRVRSLWITLESIARGTTRPAGILVWLDESLQHRELPARLERLRSRGVEFGFVKDVGPHQKYFYALKIARELNVSMATVDDDCIYPAWWLSRLYAEHLKTPECIVCYRARRIMFEDDGGLGPYNNWPLVDFDRVDPRVFFTGVSGVLYPKSFIPIIESAGDGFLRQCPKADDVWLNFLAARSDFPARQIHRDAWAFPEVPMTRQIALWTSNSAGGNDEQISRTYDAETLRHLSNSRLAERAAEAPMSGQADSSSDGRA